MVTNNFKENFNFITNILILTILVMGGISYGDTNGLWTFATDIRGGVFGADEQGVTNNFTFINPVYFNSQLNSTNVSNLNKVIVNDITGKTGVFSKDLNLTTNVSSQNSLFKISSLNAFSAIDFYNGTSNKWGLGKDPQNGFYIDQFGVANRFYINTVGNIGIGTMTPGAKLEVNGSFKANSANITTSLDANSITATNLVATNITATNSLNVGGNPVATQNDVNTRLNNLNSSIQTQINNLNPFPSGCYDGEVLTFLNGVWTCPSLASWPLQNRIWSYSPLVDYYHYFKLKFVKNYAGKDYYSWTVFNKAFSYTPGAGASSPIYSGGFTTYPGPLNGTNILANQNFQSVKTSATKIWGGFMVANDVAAGGAHYHSYTIGFVGPALEKWSPQPNEFPPSD